MKKISLILIFLFILTQPLTVMAKTPKFFKHAGGDVKELFTSWPLLILIGGGALTAGLTQIDQDINTSLNPAGKRQTFNDTLGIVGSPYVVDGLAGLTFVSGYLLHKPQLANTGEVLAESLVFTESLALGLKLAVGRNRPNGGHYSFPSAHAARFFAVATVLETLHGPAVGIPSYLLAGLVSFSRVDSHAHNLSDVVFGSALGASIGWAAARFHKHTGDYFITPLVGQNQTGVMVTRQF